MNIYLERSERYNSGKAYFIKKENNGAEVEGEKENCFLVGWKGSLEI